jgi:Ni,Fe-hydrogenase I large subunit
MDDTLDKFMLQQGVYINGKIDKLDASLIREQVLYARYSSGSNLHPLKGETEADPHKPGAYSWVKAPRYNGQPLEAGPLPRIALSYFSGNAAVKKEVDALLKVFNKEISAIFSVLGRHACRAIEAKLICRQLEEWVEDIDVGGSPRNTYEIPDQGQGEGLVEAPRGALGHWIVVKDKKIANYQCVVPTTWFCSPRDDKGVMGPLEQALIGTPVADNINPIEVARVVRSFDPCLACAIHIIESGRDIAKFKMY